MKYARDGFSVKAKIAKKQPLPEWYLDEPLLYPGDDFYIRAFWNLNTCRTSTDYSTGPIPWDKIVYYAEREGLDDCMVNVFQVIIRQMDDAYVKWNNEQIGKAIKRNG